MCGKQVFVAMEKTFAVGDHDFTKASIIPSVALQCAIPDSILTTFFQGKVHVGLKNAVFEPSSPLHHATELLPCSKTMLQAP